MVEAYENTNVDVEEKLDYKIKLSVNYLSTSFQKHVVSIISFVSFEIIESRFFIFSVEI